ncbi:hypothetical protein [Beijerinckia indica]|uniref:Glycine zipper domain-containing protein n=1 Tax=Beijerinckia indica subsp. indica (strain ATCC 9039 / DSM 1715 / NCIMB 8712) TaxID=395963 RepID=B2IHR9_BEII9|nr:hypothetical protein [Beijerinckia indica]ACB95962.1 conserved hypothetical protein [Beijerinckia indica subsp. indica ATCC 9039]
MNKIMSMAAGFLVVLALAGCGYTPEQRALSGAALGGASGAAIGAAAGNSPGAAVAGGLLGAATGGLVGAATAPPPPPPPPPPCQRYAYDEYGRPFCARAGGYGY